jgi:PPOX class probable F420-dependent enzyme
VDVLSSARRAVLATIREDGSPRLVPIAYAVAHDGDAMVLYSALDEKPKTVGDVRDLARVRDIVARPRVELVVDQWSEDWTELAWVRLDGTASLLDPADEAADPASASEHARAVSLLRQRYLQYETQRLEAMPVIRIAVERVTEWRARP